MTLAHKAWRRRYEEIVAVQGEGLFQALRKMDGCYFEGFLFEFNWSDTTKLYTIRALSVGSSLIAEETFEQDLDALAIVTKAESVMARCKAKDRNR